MRNLLILMLLLVSFTVSAQYTKVNFALKAELERQTDQNKLFPLFVIGDASKIRAEVIELKGEVVRSVKNVVQVKLPVNRIEDFSKNSFVESIPYSFSKGVVLNDTMTIHNNVTPIHNGLSPLLQPYTGKGVLFGLIDTGLDIEHPDFKDTLGNTRIYRIWDQVTGQIWDSTSINNASCTHADNIWTSHGTHVSGIAAGNGLALNMYRGVAPEATIVAVASNESAPNWLSTVVDAVDYIYAVADSLNMPCVINISMGDYFGSHDGTDPAALLIDSIVNYKPGRAFVCAGGNAGFFNWHIDQSVTTDTSFTWFKYNPSTTVFGFGNVYYELWSDTADFNNVDFAFGANLPSGSFEERARTPFYNIQNRLGNYVDTLKNGGNVLAIVETYAEIQDDKYLLQVMLNEPDSNTYHFSLLNTGSGQFDIWTHHWFGIAEIVESGLPSVGQYPPIAHYTLPDSVKTTVSSFSCSPNLLTVANFVNRKTYVDVDTILRVNTGTPGEKGVSSSLGPDRRGNIKPDIGATGDFTIGPNSDTTITLNLASPDRFKIALGGMHRYNGGTSMASPVVAGVAALYLEKCPNATMAEIKAAVTGTASQDTFTGPVPNNAFGYGKVNGFAALNNSNYAVSLGADVDFCDGDSVLVMPPSFSSYLWSTGDTTQSIYLDTTGTVHVEVTNSSGCISQSDTLNVMWHPIPTKPVITLVGQDSLIYASNLDMQWYYNSNALGGETDTIHIAQNNGDYYVQVTDSFGCVNNSDTVTIILLGIEKIENMSYLIYPNPSTGKITITLQEKGINSVSLINLLGEVLLDQKVTYRDTKLALDFEHLAEGVYYVRLTGKGKNYLQKLILLR